MNDSKRAKLEFIELAKHLDASNLEGTLQTCRRLVSLADDLGLYGMPFMKAIIGFESETETMPVGDARKLYAATYLEQLDMEFGAYLQRRTSDLLESCRIAVQFVEKMPI